MKKLLFIILFVCIKQVNGQVCFTSTNYTAGSSPSSVCSADFNGDGKLDLAITNSNANDISVLLGTGSGSFGTATNFTVGTYPFSITSADFNGDGKADLATANEYSSDISILLGNGTGGFTATTKPLGGVYPIYIIHADFNGDGKTDLATSGYLNNRLFVLLGNGSGNFSIDSTAAVNGLHYTLTSNDFNGDGIPDLATTDSSNKVFVFIGTSTGSFGSATGFSVCPFASLVTSADFNGDGKIDLAVAGNSTFILLGTGTGSFGNANSIVGNNGILKSLISNDFNGDGKIDLATANEYNQVHVSLGNGTGGFSTAVNFTTATNPESITSGDFNGDGKVDLATANQGSNNTTVFLNSTDYISISATTSNICSGATSVLTASGCTTYDWSTNATTASISVTPIVTTTYSVTDGIGCSNTASTTINIPTPSVPYICMISTDSASNYQYNVIYWDKTLYNNVDSFIVYRYDVITSSYLYIGAVNKNSLSLFKDTAFSIGGPNGGNPLYSSWQYKLAIRDTCGNIGVKGPYHQSMFVQESNATFSWNAYTIESGQSNPLTGYSFLRDDNNTGSWHVLVNTSGTSATDPNYTSFPNGNWRIDALGFNCTPTFFHAVNNSTNSIANNKSHSNTTKPEATGINQLQVNKSLLAIYPNPSNGNINISSSKNIDELKVTDVLGQLIYEAKPNTTNTSIVIDNAGIYFVTINAGKEISTKKIIVNK